MIVLTFNKEKKRWVRSLHVSIELFTYCHLAYLVLLDRVDSLRCRSFLRWGVTTGKGRKTERGRNRMQTFVWRGYMSGNVVDLKWSQLLSPDHFMKESQSANITNKRHAILNSYLRGRKVVTIKYYVFMALFDHRKRTSLNITEGAILLYCVEVFHHLG